MYWMNADGTGVLSIPEPGNHSLGDPDLSPDGQKIAFADGAYIYIMNADGTGLTQLTTEGYGEDPKFSPDGHKILYHDGGAEQFGTWIMNVDGTGRTLLYPTPANAGDYYTSFSPDGTKIVFNRSDWNEPYTERLATMNLNGTGYTELFSGALRPTSPVFTSDGRKIIFALEDGASEVSHICSINVDGTGMTQLTTGNYEDVEPKIFDGKIYFVTTRDGNREIYRMNMDGSGLENVTRNPAEDVFNNT